jgi:hypothetical protein
MSFPPSRIWPWLSRSSPDGRCRIKGDPAGALRLHALWCGCDVCLPAGWRERLLSSPARSRDHRHESRKRPRPQREGSTSCNPSIAMVGSTRAFGGLSREELYPPLAEEARTDEFAPRARSAEQRRRLCHRFAFRGQPPSAWPLCHLGCIAEWWPAKRDQQAPEHLSGTLRPQ